MTSFMQLFSLSWLHQHKIKGKKLKCQGLNLLLFSTDWNSRKHSSKHEQVSAPEVSQEAAEEEVTAGQLGGSELQQPQDLRLPQ